MKSKSAAVNRARQFVSIIGGPSMMIRCAVDKRSAMIPDTTSGRGLHLTQAD